MFFRSKPTHPGETEIEAFRQGSDADLICGILQDHGIPARVEQVSSAFSAIYLTPAQSHLVLVPDEHAAAATTLLEDLAASAAHGGAAHPHHDEVIEVEAVRIPKDRPIEDAPPPEPVHCEQCGSPNVIEVVPPRWPLVVLGTTILLSPLLFRLGLVGRFGWFFLILFSGITYFRTPKVGNHCHDCGWNSADEPPFGPKS